MGQNVSTSRTPPHVSLHDCLIDGQINPANRLIYSKRTYGDDCTHPENMKHSMSVKRHPILSHSDNGDVHSVNFKY